MTAIIEQINRTQWRVSVVDNGTTKIIDGIRPNKKEALIWVIEALDMLKDRCE
jgi:hypothetical protein